MDIFSFLEIDFSSDKSAVDSAYHKKLKYYHPSKKTGSEEMFMELNKLYKEYLLGNDFVNCSAVCDSEKQTQKCRCGGIYEIYADYFGRIDCDFCSCFIIVRKPIKKIIKENI